MKKLILLSAAVAFIACGKKSEGQGSAAPTAPAAAAGVSGETVYNEKGCVGCHGAQGKGDGPAGVAVKARNFTDAKWKNGTDLASVMKTIESGIAGTSMAPYKGQLSADELKAVAEHVRKLGNK